MASTLTSDMEESSEYINSSVALPPESTITSIGENFYDSRMFTKNQVKQLWDSYKAEYSLLSLDKKLILSTAVNQTENVGISNNLSPFNAISIKGNYGTNYYENYYQISLNTPKTAALYLNMINQKEKSVALKAISADLKADTSANYYYIIVYNDTDLADDPEISMNMNQSNVTHIANNKKALNLLLSQSDETLDITKPFVWVNIEGNNYYQNISKQDIAKIKALASS